MAGLAGWKVVQLCSNDDEQGEDRDETQTGASQTQPGGEPPIKVKLAILRNANCCRGIGDSTVGTSMQASVERLA